MLVSFGFRLFDSILLIKSLSMDLDISRSKWAKVDIMVPDEEELVERLDYHWAYLTTFTQASCFFPDMNLIISLA
jgi:hypothetical protein